MSSSIKPSTLIVASVGTAVLGFVAYAIYFDHRRRTDPDFRKALKRESKKQARAQKIQAQASAANQMKEIKAAVAAVNEETLPSSPEEVEQFFMTELAQGEKLCTDESQHMEAAMSFFRALKVYPQKSELINIYDKTVPKPILDILAHMIALDETSLGGSVHDLESDVA